MTQKTKSPFLIFQDFLSPKVCEQLVDQLDFTAPDTNTDGKSILTTKTNEKAEELIFYQLQNMLPEILEYYGIGYQGMEYVTFEFYDVDAMQSPHAENSSFIRQKWVRNKNRDLTCVLFLSDYNDNVPFDGEYEVYGGKLEFPQHHFSFNPQRGTMIVFPSVPHFINATSEVLAGELYQARFHIAADKPLLYNPKDFPGNYTNWFNDVD